VFTKPRVAQPTGASATAADLLANLAWDGTRGVLICALVLLDDISGSDAADGVPRAPFGQARCYKLYIGEDVG